MPDDGFLPGFVYTKDLLEQAKKTESWIAKDWKRTRNSRKFWKAATGFFAFTTAGLVFCLSYAMPLRTIWPIIIYKDEVGITHTDINPDNLQAMINGATYKKFLFDYMAARESYLPDPVVDQGHYDLVMAMSSDAVREAYVKWHDPKNPNSYIAQFGTHGKIYIKPHDDNPEWRPAVGDQPGVITFYYDMIIMDEFRKPLTKTFKNTFRYILNTHYSGLSLRQITENNPLGIEVIDYPGPQEPRPGM